MEYMQCEELTRIEILERLKKRELFVPNVDKLSLEELEQIYKGFIVPQPRRERRDRASLAADMSRKTTLELPMEMQHLSRRIEVVSVTREKRTHDADSQMSTSCARKRIKTDQNRLTVYNATKSSLTEVVIPCSLIQAAERSQTVFGIWKSGLLECRHDSTELQRNSMNVKVMELESERNPEIIFDV